MAEFIPASQIRAGASSLPVYFSQRIHEILELPQLVGLFAGCIAPFGVPGHACLRLDTAPRQVFGEGELPEPERVLGFAVRGWDGNDYRVDLSLTGLAPGEPDLDPTARAALHAMSALYVLRGIALLDADDEPADPCRLSKAERFCLEQSELGRCDLDIGEELGRSAPAVRVLVERARAKLRPALLNG